MTTRILATTVALLCLTSSVARTQQAAEFGTCAGRSEPTYSGASLHAMYLPMRDGVRIAVDVILPDNLKTGDKIPAILMMTRYWRARENDPPSTLQLFFVKRGYAIISGDARGTGASFGTWRYSRSTTETRDYAEIVDWIVKQPWSNGKVGSTGTSYGANAADFLVKEGHPAVKAVIPVSPDFDAYADMYYPGGILHTAFGQQWGDGVKAQDLNVKRGNPPRGVRPVDDDPDGKVLAQAVQIRKDEPTIYAGLSQIVFRDDKPAVWNASMNDWSIHSYRADLDRSTAAMYTWASWMDAGTGDGALHRFMTLKSPQRVIIGPWSHGARMQSSPFAPVDTPNDPPTETQWQDNVCFFDHYLKDVPNRMGERLLTYYTMGEEKWKTTNVWPPAGSGRPLRFYLAANHSLSRSAPTASRGDDSYPVDFDVTTGVHNRWYTQHGGGDVVYPDRTAADKRLLVYDSDPLDTNVEITGNPVVNLELTSSTPEMAAYVYLEDVAPDGAVTYVTDGQLASVMRTVSKRAPPYTMVTPYHSFMRADAAPPIVPGAVTQLRFGLLPTSALIRHGHRVRIAIAGADKDTFARIPAAGATTLVLLRNSSRASYVDLPVVARP